MGSEMPASFGCRCEGDDPSADFYTRWFKRVAVLIDVDSGHAPVAVVWAWLRLTAKEVIPRGDQQQDKKNARHEAANAEFDSLLKDAEHRTSMIAKSQPLLNLRRPPGSAGVSPAGLSRARICRQDACAPRPFSCNFLAQRQRSRRRHAVLI